ncbi:MAG: hypothetical protein BGO76_00765 [Caedibacter sp. 38-128]|nr:DUF2125 domain-containing protein [Holosporales bacterium]OJX05180.1 MAG: hypothetical protein BGO76_00765 [Caedibacter sp. 38-128]
MTHSQSSKLRRLLPRISIISLVLIFAGYTYLWFNQAHWLEERVNHEIALLKSHQETILEHEGVTVTGFPWKLEVKILNPRLASKRWGSGLLQIDGLLEIESTVLSPKTIVVNALGKTKLIYTPAPQLASLMLEFEDFQGIFKIHHKDYLLKTLKFYDLHLKMLKNRVNIEEFSFSALTQEEIIRPPLTRTSMAASQEQILSNSDSSRSFALKIYRMKINDHCATKLPSLLESLETIVHLEETFNLFAANPFQEWTKKGGLLEIEKLAFEWGSLTGEGNGTLAFDHESQPLAAFSTKISGLETFLDQLAQEKIIRRNIATIAKLSLGLFQDKSTPDREPPRHTIALSLQKGDLSIGPLTIAKLPSIKWPSR